MSRKLHAPGPDNRPLCGRQLSSHERAQDQSSMRVTGDLPGFRLLEEKRQCNWCRGILGLESVRPRRSWSGDDNGDSFDE